VVIVVLPISVFGVGDDVITGTCHAITLVIA
jgi:hypothetical protein